jgi:hypothetical protein
LLIELFSDLEFKGNQEPLLFGKAAANIENIFALLIDVERILPHPDHFIVFVVLLGEQGGQLDDRPFGEVDPGGEI